MPWQNSPVSKSCPPIRWRVKRSCPACSQIKLLFSLVVFAGVYFSPVRAENLDPPRADPSQFLPLCLGFDTRGQVIGPKFARSDSPGSCPADHAFIAIDTVTGRDRPVEDIPLIGYCCPLPEGSLHSETVSVIEHCPADFLATGSHLDEHGKVFLDCTKLDVSRYSLAESNSGAALEPAVEFFPKLLAWVESWFSHPGARRIAWNEIPVAMRYGFSRRSETQWGWESCLGARFGSFLVGRKGVECYENSFAQLLLRSHATNVSSLVGYSPRCLAIDDVRSGSGKCLPE